VDEIELVLQARQGSERSSVHQLAGVYHAVLRPEPYTQMGRLGWSGKDGDQGRAQEAETNEVGGRRLSMRARLLDPVDDKVMKTR
jgi:hypothetical protein